MAASIELARAVYIQIGNSSLRRISQIVGRGNCTPMRTYLWTKTLIWVNKLLKTLHTVPLTHSVCRVSCWFWYSSLWAVVIPVNTPTCSASFMVCFFTSQVTAKVSPGSLGRANRPDVRWEGGLSPSCQLYLTSRETLRLQQAKRSVCLLGNYSS